MDNIMNSIRRFFKNKNTVTILGVLLILVLLFWGYNTQINRATDPVEVVVATETIQPRTEITDDMVQIVKMPRMAVSDNVIRYKNSVVGKYSNINSVIPAGSMLYNETVVSKDELPDAAFAKVKDGEVVYNFPVDMESTYGNSIFPGNIIDIYMKVGNGTDEKIMIGKLVENVEVLAVKDSSGRAVFENTDEARTPSMMIFGLNEEKDSLYSLLKKASYLESLGVELYPVPHGGEVSEEGATVASTQQLIDYVNAHSVDIPKATTQTETAEVDELLPVISQKVSGRKYTVTITYPKGCGSTYTCSYSKNGGRAISVKKTKQTVSYTTTGVITATVTEKDKTEHTVTESVPTTKKSTSNTSTNETTNSSSTDTSTNTNSNVGTN